MFKYTYFDDVPTDDAAHLPQLSVSAGTDLLDTPPSRHIPAQTSVHVRGPTAPDSPKMKAVVQRTAELRKVKDGFVPRVDDTERPPSEVKLRGSANADGICERTSELRELKTPKPDPTGGESEFMERISRSPPQKGRKPVDLREFTASDPLARTVRDEAALTTETDVGSAQRTATDLLKTSTQTISREPTKPMEIASSPPSVFTRYFEDRPRPQPKPQSPPKIHYEIKEIENRPPTMVERDSAKPPQKTVRFEEESDRLGHYDPPVIKDDYPGNPDRHIKKKSKPEEEPVIAEARQNPAFKSGGRHQNQSCVNELKRVMKKVEETERILRRSDRALIMGDIESRRRKQRMKSAREAESQRLDRAQQTHEKVVRFLRD
jgi:hypothetical protein